MFNMGESPSNTVTIQLIVNGIGNGTSFVFTNDQTRSTFYVDNNGTPITSDTYNVGYDSGTHPYRVKAPEGGNTLLLLLFGIGGLVLMRKV